MEAPSPATIPTASMRNPSVAVVDQAEARCRLPFLGEEKLRLLAESILVARVDPVTALVMLKLEIPA